MSFQPSNLFRWTGTVNRLPYFLAGVTLLVVKFAMDWMIARLIFERDWTLTNYLAAPTNTLRVFTLADPDRVFLGTLLVLALPFIFIGIALTVQRLRAAGLSVGLAVFFFVPVANLFFFVILCLLPNRPAPTVRRPVIEPVREPGSEGIQHLPGYTGEVSTGIEHLPAHPASGDPDIDPVFRTMMGPERFARFRAAHRRITKGEPWPSAAVALLISVPVALVFVYTSVHGLRNYGWGLFVGMPFCLGFGSVVLYGLARPQGFAACMGIAFLATTLVGVAMLFAAMEGFICLLMAAPIGYFLTFVGAVVGYAIQSRPWSNHHSPFLLLALMLTLPSLMGAEALAQPEPPLLEVRTVIDIDAPPEKVWQHVVSFPPLPEPEEWFFRAGIAYPIRAEIHGHGPGAVRHCIFSTGAFVEPIEVWDEPYLLRFRVTEQPCPMVEWSPFDIHPPHLDHYLVSRRGQFHLIPLPGGRTRLEGTTWYTNHMWPAAYWQLWSDPIIHQIHQRVLEHIKRQVEK